MSVVYRTNMKIPPKIAIISLTLTLANLHNDSVFAQSGSSCYMIDPSGHTIDLMDLCSHSSKESISQDSSPESKPTDEQEFEPLQNPEGNDIITEDPHFDNEKDTKINDSEGVQDNVERPSFDRRYYRRLDRRLNENPSIR